MGNLKLTETSRKFKTRVKQLMLKEMFSTQTVDLGMEEFQDLMNSNYSIQLRAIWALIILCCTCTFLYQSQDRLFYYLSEPVSVDLMYKDLDEIDYPIIKVCSLENQYVYDFWKETYGGISKLDAWNCMNPAYRLMETEGKELDEIWNLDKFPPIVDTFTFQTIAKNTTIPKPNITQHLEKSVWGACDVLISREKWVGQNTYGAVVANIQSPKLCETSAIMITLKAPIDFQYTMMLYPGSQLTKNLDFKEYKFLSKKINRCIPTKEFVDCMDKCLYVQYMRQNFTCRLPFLPKEEVPYELCQTSSRTQFIYDTALKFILTSSPKKDCNCSRRCDQSVLNSWFDVSKIDSENIIGVFGIHSHYIRVVSDRWSYDEINLLTDIGGNIGLFLGLSVLSLTNIVNVIIFVQARNWKKHEKLDINPLKKKVKSVYATCKNSLEINNIKEINAVKTVSRTAKWLKNIVMVGCSLLSMYMIVAKILHFLDNPIGVNIEVEDVDYLEYPNAIHCALSPRIASQICRMKGQKPNEYGTTPIDILDMADNKKLTLDQVWEKSLLREINFKDIFSLKNLPFVVRDITNVSETLTPLGKCLKYEFGLAKYAGMFTFLLTAFDPPVWGNNSHVYVQLPEDNFIDYTSTRVMPYSNLDNVIFEMSKIERVDTKSKPCIDPPDVFYQCKQKCVTKMIQDRVKCKLPFINETDTEPCENSTAAKEARKVYMDIFINTDFQKTCHCPLPCKERFYTTRLYLLPSPVDLITIVIYFFFNNKVEHIIEFKAYGFISLMCDFGNILGLNLGLSVLSFIRYMAIMTTPFLKAIKKK